MADLESMTRELKESARRGAPEWQILICIGRIEEGRGRLDAAERAYRRAALAEKGRAVARVELAHLLEKAGRGGEGRALLEEDAARDAAGYRELSDELLVLLETAHYRRAFAAALDGRAAACEADLRGSTSLAARAALAELLLARGRLDEAEAALEEDFARPAGKAGAPRADALISLVDRGRYGAGLEKRILGLAADARGEDAVVRDWYRLFSALMCAGFYDAAFRLGEAMLDRLGCFDIPGQLMWPWTRRVPRAVNEVAFIEKELGRLRAATKESPMTHWRAFYEAALLISGGASKDAPLCDELYPIIAARDPRRYAWMAQPFVLLKLERLDFEGAIALCAVVLEHAPTHWWVRCRKAEAHLALGDDAACRHALAEAARTCAPEWRKDVLTWTGEILLWQGDYRGALASLDEAIGLGARYFAFGWRGAAKLKLGDLNGALADLTRCVELDPKDLEARCWRGEALRLMGRGPEARADLDEVIRLAPVNSWARLNRELLEDCSRARRAELEATLESARGIRRWEGYVQEIRRRRA